MLALQSLCICGTKFDAPQTDGFIADYYSSLSEYVFDIPVAQIEAMVQPDGITDDFGRESVAFVCGHAGIMGHE